MKLIKITSLNQFGRFASTAFLLLVLAAAPKVTAAGPFEALTKALNETQLKKLKAEAEKREQALKTKTAENNRNIAALKISAEEKLKLSNQLATATEDHLELQQKFADIESKNVQLETDKTLGIAGTTISAGTLILTLLGAWRSGRTDKRMIEKGDLEIEKLKEEIKALQRQAVSVVNQPVVPEKKALDYHPS